MIEALRWYAALTLIGAAGLLPAMLLFERLRSHGVLFARPIGLLLIALAVWLVAWSGAVNYGTLPIVVVLVLLIAWSATIARRRPELRRAVRERWRLLLAGEVITLALFVLILLARVQAPDATATEKPMDLMLLTAVHEASALPPPDPWFAGERVSYYHLGHTGVDVTGRLAGLGPGRSFTLGVATAGALAGAAVFALAGDVVALGSRRRATPWIAGAVALVSLLLLAPLEGLLEIAAANGIGGGLWSGLGVTGLSPPGGATGGVPDGFWWWWSATRILPGTISEFPAFSLLLGDLHAHLLVLPLSIVAVALAVVAFEGSTPLTWRRWLARPEALLVASALFAGILMTNSWDVLTFGALWAGGAAFAFLRAGWSPQLAIFGAARYLAAPVALALLLAAPWLSGLDGASIGFALVTGEHSDPARYALLWLPLALPLVVAVVLLRPSISRRALAAGLAVAALMLAAWVAALLLGGERGELAARGAGWPVLGGLAALLGAAGAAVRAASRRGDAVTAAWLSLATAALLLLLATELVRVDDAFPGRLNTVFKFWYHAWLLLALAGAVAVAGAFERVDWRALAPRPAARPLVAAGVAALALLYAGSTLYTPAMAISRAREGQTAGLDALAYLESRDPGLAAAVEWARERLDPERHVLLQAITPSYGPGSVLAAASGVPTLLGWPGHELQWRPGVALGDRQAAVDRIYREGASERTLALARSFGVTHVFVGRLEAQLYGAGVASRFEGWPAVFEASGALIVEVPAP